MERILSVVVENFELLRVNKSQSQNLSLETIQFKKAWHNTPQSMEANYGKPGWPHKIKLFLIDVQIIK